MSIKSVKEFKSNSLNTELTKSYLLVWLRDSEKDLVALNLSLLGSTKYPSPTKSNLYLIDCQLYKYKGELKMSDSLLPKGIKHTILSVGKAPPKISFTKEIFLK